MSKKLIPFLIFLVVVLGIANAVVVYRLMHKDKKAESLLQLPEKIELPTGANSTASGTGGAFPVIANYAIGDQKLGQQAGEAVQDMKKKSEEALKVLTAQTGQTGQDLEKSSAELSKTANETIQVLNVQLEQITKDFGKAAQSALESWNRELQKFNETLQKNKKS